MDTNIRQRKRTGRLRQRRDVRGVLHPWIQTSEMLCLVVANDRNFAAEVDVHRCDLEKNTDAETYIKEHQD
jgi:hypothetical protein